MNEPDWGKRTAIIGLKIALLQVELMVETSRANKIQLYDTIYSLNREIVEIERGEADE